MDSDHNDAVNSEEYSYDDIGEFDSSKKSDYLENYIEEIADTVRIGLDQSIAILTPWFFNNMPKIYYKTTPRPEKVRHLSAIITGHVFETKQTVELWDRNKTKVTYIGPGGDRQILLHMATRLVNYSLKMGSLYFSRDHLLFLSTLSCNKYRPIEWNNQLITDKIEKARKLIMKEFPDCSNEVENYLTNLDNDFVMYATEARIHLSYQMLRHMLSHEGAFTKLESFENSHIARLSIGMKDTKPQSVLYKILLLIMRYGCDIIRSFIVRFQQGLHEPITVMHFIIRDTSGKQIKPGNISILKLIKALRTLGWVDTDDYDKLLKDPYNLSINAVNFVRSSAVWVHVLLGKQNPYYYSGYKIRTTFFKHFELTEKILKLFKLRFNPSKDEIERLDQYEEYRRTVKNEVEDILDEVERNIFREVVQFIHVILKTNYSSYTKTGLAFRLSGDILDSTYYSQKPFGIYFIIGSDYRFFHVRWRDVSRGGLRIVTPRNQSEYDFALSGLFDEVYGLSYAQQQKNKDIPEGGSKAVLLLRPKSTRQRAVRGAVNALLDLLVTEDENHENFKNTVDYYKKEEIIYLGPDENMTNDLIIWVTAQATRRGYKYANAFMSSKPEAGINHKKYGVTSEGVNVYLHHALLFLSVDPKKMSFSVKMTGGPDGDVAGNELKILYREYGENPRIVSISDGFGAAYDPKGLEWKELLRLIDEGLSIAEFNQEYLSEHSDAFVIRADSAENIRLRNELAFKVKADLFIPAGGRPYTVNDKNWKKLIDEDGDPTMRVIIEGANIFFTSDARHHLEKAGVIVVKDSSANKTGVICSSYEIIASLVFEKDEFLKFKDVYVQQVIDLLREKAGLEAKLLFREYAHQSNKKNLVELSTEISTEINDVTDILSEGFHKEHDNILLDPIFQNLIFRHCPPVLGEKYREKVLKNLPKAHKIALLSSHIASYIVYKEGLGWINHVSECNRYRVAITYIRKEQLSYDYICAVETSNIKDKDKIAMILRLSAAKNLTMLDMEKESQAVMLLPICSPEKSSACTDNSTEVSSDDSQ